MQDETYDAKEAMEKLRLPVTTFYRKVKEGDIPYSVRKPRLRFPKEAIDAIAEIELGDEPEIKLVFELCTQANAWNMNVLARSIHGEENVTSFRTILAWRKVNDQISMLVNEGNKILGWSTFLPLEEEIILELIEGKMKEDDVPPQAVKRWADQQISVYIAAVEVVKSTNSNRDTEVAAFLLRNTIKWVVSLMKQYNIKNWYGVGTNPKGYAILEALGFKEIDALAEGKRKVYELGDISKPSKLLKSFLQPTVDQ